jgi:uncharacterized 2Fe-2S/4Fe-4S cluster protein (DUF4445 family)
MKKTGNQNHQSTVIFLPLGRHGYVSGNKTIMEAARELGVAIESLCGGQGACGNCKVEIKQGILKQHGINSLRENLSLLNKVEEK